MSEYIQKGDYRAVNVDGVENNEIDSGYTNRILPRQVSTGSTRGTQIVGYGGVKIDGSNNRIQLEANSTQVSIGDTSDIDNITGLALTDISSGKKLVSIGNDTSGTSVIGLTAYDGDEQRRLLAGTFPDGSVKIKLSREGYDVAVANDNQLIWSSDFNLFKIVLTGTADVVVPVAPNGSYTTTVAHGQNTIPAIIAYVKTATEDYRGVPYTDFDLGSPPSISGIWYYTINSTSVIFTIKTNNAFVAGTYTFRYYILLETAA